MDGGHDAKWNKSDRGRQIPCDITCRWNLEEYNKLVNLTKEKQAHRYWGQISDCQWERVHSGVLERSGVTQGRGSLADTGWGSPPGSYLYFWLYGFHICHFPSKDLLWFWMAAATGLSVSTKATADWDRRRGRRGSLWLAFSGSQVRMRTWRTCENPEAVPTPRVSGSVVGPWDAEVSVGTTLFLKKGYIPFTIIIKYLLYSLCCTVYPCGLCLCVNRSVMSDSLWPHGL